jgi:glutamyl-Q tRNA(Asp) synthetase
MPIVGPTFINLVNILSRTKFSMSPKSRQESLSFVKKDRGSYDHSEQSGRGGAVIRTRFAPSPTGFLHLGHAYSAIINFERVCAGGGEFLLRIEDIDQTRCRPEYEDAILEDLAWLGLSWSRPVMRQSDRLSFYEGRLKSLHERGLVYRCFRTRQDINEAMTAPHAASSRVFRGGPLSSLEEHDKLAAGHAYAWRLSLTAAEAALGSAFSGLSFVEETGEGLVPRAAEPWRCGDVVLGRKDIGTSYHLSSVLDDTEQGVTHVIRGEDLREAAGLHALLHALFELDPPVYRHHRLITNEAGRRLSKRDRAATLRAMREAGVTPAEIRARLFDGLK